MHLKEYMFDGGMRCSWLPWVNSCNGMLQIRFLLHSLFFHLVRETEAEAEAETDRQRDRGGRRRERESAQKVGG